MFQLVKSLERFSAPQEPVTVVEPPSASLTEQIAGVIASIRLQCKTPSFLTKWWDLLDLSQEKNLLDMVYICPRAGVLPSPCFSNFLARTTFVLESLPEAKNPGQDAIFEDFVFYSTVDQLQSCHSVRSLFLGRFWTKIQSDNCFETMSTPSLLLEGWH